jgi:hypothetical protein
LLPTKKYFEQIREPIISFASSTNTFSNFSKIYGPSISDYNNYENFLLGTDGRKDPSFYDISTPNVLSKNLLEASKVQHVAIDDWQFPPSIELIQIAGWGVQTVKGIEYDKKVHCSGAILNSSCQPTLVMKPQFSVEGDGTVLYPSAIESEGTQLYFNIKQYNSPQTGKNENRKHADILETESVKDLVRNTLTGVTDLPQYITSTKPLTKEGRLLVSLTASTTLSARNSSGEYTGFVANPNPDSDLKISEQAISNSFYVDYGDTKYIGLDTDEPAQLTFQGNGYGTFTLGTTITEGDEVVSVSTFTDIPVTPQMQGEILNPTSILPILAIDVDGDGGVDATTTVTESFDPILYIEIMKKTVESFELKSLIKKNLITKLDRLQELIKKGKIINADKKIQKFIRQTDRKGAKLRKITDNERDQIVGMLTVLTNELI